MMLKSKKPKMRKGKQSLKKTSALLTFKVDFLRKKQLPKRMWLKKSQSSFYLRRKKINSQNVVQVSLLWKVQQVLLTLIVLLRKTILLVQTQTLSCPKFTFLKISWSLSRVIGLRINRRKELALQKLRRIEELLLCRLMKEMKKRWRKK